MANFYDDELARALERLDAERGRDALALPGTETPVSSADMRQRSDSPLAEPAMRPYSEIFGTGKETDRVRDFPGEEKAAKKEKTANMMKGLSLVFASLSDAAEGLTLAGQKGRRGPSQVQVLLENERAERQMKASEATQQRADAREDRVAKFQELTYQRQITEMILKKRQQDFDNLGKFLDYGDRIAAMTDPDVAINTLKGAAKTFEVPFAEEWIEGLVANKDVATQLGPAYRLLQQDPNTIGYLLNARRQMQGPDKGRQLMVELKEQASRVALGEITRRAPRFRGDTLDAFAKAMEEVNPHIAGALRGSVPMDAPTRQSIQDVLTANGIQTPALAAKEKEQEALLSGKIKEQEALIPGKVKEQEALLPGRVELENRLAPIREKIAAATGQNVANVKLEMEETKPLNEHAVLWIDPKTGRAATPTQSLRDVKALGFVPITQSGITTSVSARAALAQIIEYRELAPRLLVQGGSGVAADITAVQANRARLAALRRAGNPDVKRLDALFGAIATLARATGDTANVAVQERKFLQEFVVTDEDTVQSSTAKLDQAERILNSIIAGHGLPVPPKGNTSLTPAEERALKRLEKKE